MITKEVYVFPIKPFVTIPAGIPRALQSKTLLACLLMFQLSAGICANAHAYNPFTEDPIHLSKEIISGYPEHWSRGADTEIIRNYKLKQELVAEDRIYLLLESPGIAIDLMTGPDGPAGNYISRAVLLELLKNAVVAPEATSKNIARTTLGSGLEDYKKAFNIAGEFQQKQEISLEEAIAFLDNRYGYAKLEDAKELLTASDTEDAGSLDNKKIRDKLKTIEKVYPANIRLEDAQKEVYEFYRLLESESVGIAAYAPYTRFRSVMEELNKSRIAQRRKFRSTIKISDPKRATVWMLNDPVSLEWITSNISSDKSLRFFLVKGETVVQELGTFKNTGSASGIRLNKNIDSGDDYKVVGIELFPANKYYIAKMATAKFTIRRPKRPERPAVVNTKSNIIKSTPSVVRTESPAAERISFEGRKISYVKELTVDAKDIRISIWDHGRQDEDIVSIYLNGEPVVAKHYLTYQKKHFDIHLDAGKKNDLFLYAHNLGYYPPNTVSIEIVDNSSSENIVLNSDLKSCEAVLINVNQ